MQRDRLQPLVRRSKELASRLPEPAQRALRDWRDRLSSPSDEPIEVDDPAPVIELPADVANADAVRRRLAETDLFDDPAEGEGYLADALERFRLTIALVPPLAPGARALELGSNPYFVTRLLRERGLEVTSANWFGPNNGIGDEGVQTVVESGVAHDYRFDHFNMETDTFPYPDGTFDLVLFCEILEHLPYNPVQSLAEIHRVLKPGGQVLITTPNAARAENLNKVLHGENMYEVLSGHGTYGRHNREYTVAELRKLLEAEGFESIKVFAMDIHPWAPTVPPHVRASRTNRGENLFALARAVGEPRWRYPEWLYISRHAIRRMVRPDVRIGYNDDLQTRGLHGLEDHQDPPFRWTGPEDALIWLRNDFSGGRVRVEGVAPPPAAGVPVQLSVSVGEATVSWTVPCTGEPFALEADLDAPAGEFELRLRAERTWRPADVGDGKDGRQLGVALTRIAMVAGTPAGSAGQGAGSANDRTP